LLLLTISGIAFGQYDGSAQQAQLDDALGQLNARILYLETGLTPGDWAKLSEPEKEKISARVQCKEIHAQIDEQLALENAGHVGFYNWRSLREIENRKTACGGMTYRLGESPNDTYPAEYAKQQAARSMPMPSYPIEALRRGHQGTVGIQVDVAKDGSVTNAVVTQSSGYPELDKAAQANAYRWKLDPSKGAMQTFPVNFHLNPSH
jgi:TonB family protein